MYQVWGLLLGTMWHTPLFHFQYFLYMYYMMLRTKWWSKLHYMYMSDCISICFWPGTGYNAATLDHGKTLVSSFQHRFLTRFDAPVRSNESKSKVVEMWDVISSWHAVDGRNAGPLGMYKTPVNKGIFTISTGWPDFWTINRSSCVRSWTSPGER